MIIILKQADLESALSVYIEKQGLSLQGKSLDITFTAGRGETGHSAQIEISDAKEVAPAVVALTKAVVSKAKADTQAAAAPEPAAEATDEASPPVVASKSLFGG